MEIKFKENVTSEQAAKHAEKLGNEWVHPNVWELYTIYEARRLGHPELQELNGFMWSSVIDPCCDEYTWGVDFDTDLEGDDPVMGYNNNDDTGNAVYVKDGTIKTLVEWILER